MGPKCSNQDELARVLSLSRIMNAKGDVEFNYKGTTQLLTKRAKTFVAPPYDTYGTDVEIRIFILKAIHILISCISATRDQWNQSSIDDSRHNSKNKRMSQ